MEEVRLLKLLAILSIFVLSAASSAQSVPHATGVAHTADVDLAYETFGARGASLPVIAVNGGPGLSHAYMMVNDLWQRVGKDHFVVLYDQRGTGRSKPVRDGAPQTMAAQVADLDAVRAALKLDKVALVGDSYGGMLSMAYAVAHPEHVAKLVLSDSPPPEWKSMVHLLPEVFPDMEASGAAEEKRLGEGSDAAEQAGLRNHFRMIFYSPEKRDAYMAKMGDLGFEPGVAAAVSQSAGEMDLTAQIKEFRFPVLVITGRYDMNVAPLTAWRMAHEIPGARIVFFEKSGHLPAYEEPDKYLAVLDGFLDEK
jgi:proline iminopeptidase